MTSISFGDMASALRTMRITNSVKQDLNNYNQEVASGLKHDLNSSVSGDYNPLASVDRAIRTLNAYETSIKEAELMATGTQVSLEAIATHVSEVSGDLLSAASMGDATSIAVNALDAKTRLDSVVSAINARIAGRSLFSGAATGVSPITSADQLIADVSAAITAAGATTPADIETVLNDWFDTTGGGFETTTYQGSTTPRAQMVLSETDKVELETTALDPALRDILKGLTAAAIVDTGAPLTEVEDQATLLRYSGETLLSAESGLAHIRASVGSVEGRIESAKLSNTAATYSYETAKSDITSADLYEASARLTQSEAQLELIYTLTARLSRLSLSDYL